jgi:hypothetical protein
MTAEAFKSWTQRERRKAPPRCGLSAAVLSRVGMHLDSFRTPLTNPQTARLIAKIYTDGQAAPLNPASNRSIAVTTSYSRSLSKVLLSTAAGIHNASASVEEKDVSVVQVTYVPWAPFVVFAALLLAYAAFSAWVCWDVWWRARVVRTVEDDSDGDGMPDGKLKQVTGRLAEPGTVIFDAIGSSDVSRLSREEMGDVRLRLGRRSDGRFGIHT